MGDLWDVTCMGNLWNVTCMGDLWNVTCKKKPCRLKWSVKGVQLTLHRNSLKVIAFSCIVHPFCALFLA